MIQFSLTSKANLLPSRQLAKATSSIVADTILDDEIVYCADLALYEACSNAVRHAYKNREPGDIHILLTLTPFESIEVKVMDWGHGFATYPVTVKNAPPEAEYGRGLYIISQFADTFDIRKEGGANVIYFKLLVKENLWTSLE